MNELISPEYLQQIFQKKLRHKFNAKPTNIDDKRFPSKAESKYYQLLKTLQERGVVLFFLRQVPFDLPGGITYRLDFLVFYSDGDIKFIDVKGFKTKDFIMKKKLLEETYPIQLEIIK